MEKTCSIYDIVGRRTSQTWPDAFAMSYTWDAANAMKTIVRSGSPIVTYGYDDWGRRSSITRANGVGTTYAYDDVSRLTSLAHGGSTSLTLGFTYNPAGQIIARTMSNAAFSYTGPAGPTYYLVDRLNRVSSANGVSFSYDGDSNLTNDGARTYAYDAAGRLTSNGTSAATLSYDAWGRLDRLVGAAGGRFVYDGMETTAIADPATNVISNHFVRGPGVDEIVANYQTGALNSPIFWLLDQQNSLIALTNVSGATTSTNAYDEFGIPRAGNAARYQYTGQLLMPDFGAYHYRARAYASGLGRFLQADPLGYGAGMNLYAYVGNDPINFSDPAGLQACYDNPNGSQTCGPIGEISVTANRLLLMLSRDWVFDGISYDGGSGGVGYSGGGGGSGAVAQPSLPADRERCKSLVATAKVAGDTSIWFGRAALAFDIAAVAAVEVPPAAAAFAGVGQGLGIVSLGLNISSVVAYGSGTQDWTGAAILGIQTGFAVYGPLGRGVGESLASQMGDELVNLSNIGKGCR